MVKLTQLILHIGDEMNLEQKRYGYGQANSDCLEQIEDHIKKEETNSWTKTKS